MTAPRRDPASPPADPRDALADSERRATETEPQNYRDQANAEKLVEIPPTGPDEKPIRGLDPD